MGCLGNNKTEDQRNEEKAQREANKKIEKQLQKDKQIYRATHRLLLLGGFCEGVLAEATCSRTSFTEQHFKSSYQRMMQQKGDVTPSDLSPAFLRDGGAGWTCEEADGRTLLCRSGERRLRDLRMGLLPACPFLFPHRRQTCKLPD